MLFTNKMKLADVLNNNHSLVLMLQRFNIELGFGEKTVEEVCKQYHIDDSFFLLICNVYTHHQYLPTGKDLSDTDMRGLIPYLIASHKYYLLERIPHIERHLNDIAETCQPNHKAILQRFFMDYTQEVSNHFDYEEKIVFPYINALTAGKRIKEYTITQFEDNHSNIEDKLEDLTNILIKYLPGNILPKKRIGLLFDIFQLSGDINEHVLIEEKILIPYVQSLEKIL